ncbi:XAC0095 family protein [Noviluteimonas gilva]|uniref:XAC0095 family protein n=1 Tax=Noviluteimonas gilva TaxID=2682097 RepID=UPI003CCD7447
MRPQKPTVLVVAESSQLTLIQMRDHMRLLSRLTETGTAASSYDNLFRPDALAWWFSRLARDLEELLKGIRYDHELASRHAAAPALNDRRVRSALRTPQRTLERKPLDRSDPQGDAPAWCVPNSFPKKFGTHHVRAAR